MNLKTLARDGGVAARLGARALRRRLRGRGPGENPDLWRRDLEHWLASLPDGAVRGHRWLELPATRPPWTTTGLAVEAGDRLSWFATGRVVLSRTLDLWVPPSFQLWARVAPHGPVFRGTRNSHTCTAPAAGPLELASYFPGEWRTPAGLLGTDPDDYRRVSGGMTVLVVHWRRDLDVAAALATPGAPPVVQAELERLQTPLAAPDGWDYLWTLGPGELFRGARTATGAPSIVCHTHGDVGILRRPVRLPLAPGTVLRWRWRVDELPADLREDTLPSHDYLSLAVEFDDGQDLTYYWSAALPVGTVYRCPLPTWQDKETHVVVRSGPAGLGAWHDECRDLAADYRRIVGGPARSVVRVWLIANSLFLRGRGRCEYAGIELAGGDGTTIQVL